MMGFFYDLSPPSYPYNLIMQQELITYLSDFITEERNRKLKEVLQHRTRYITVVLEDLYQTQNISAVMRTCECYGVQDVHIIEKENDFQIHSAISMGANKWLNLYNYKNNNDNIRECIKNLKNKGYQIIATVPSEQSISIHELALDTPMAFCFGTELTGLSNEIVAMADQCVRIPMYGFTESFNISNSVAIILSYFIEKIKKENINWTLSEEEKETLHFEWLRKSVKESSLIIDKYLTIRNLE